MYESISPYNGDSKQNEITIHNLIAVASNPKLYEALEHGTQKKLVQFIASYTKKCLDNIEKHNYEETNTRELYNNQLKNKKR